MKRNLDMMMKKQAGFLTITAVILIVAIGALTSALFFMFSSSSRSGTDLLTANQAFYAAESGLEFGVYSLYKSDITNREKCNDLSNYTNIPLGTGIPGTYTLQDTNIFTTSPGLLSSSINSADTIIPLTTISPYAATGGRVLINREAIDYTSVSQNNTVCGGNAPCLFGVTRGVDDTTARSHSNGTRVGQAQCIIRSTGTVDVAGLNSQQYVLTAVQQSFFVAVGKRKNGAYLTKWQDSEWQRFSTSGLPDADLLSVDMLSYVDGWAVGKKKNNKLNLLRWNGNQWLRVLPTKNINKNLNAVKCVSEKDCWAVGDDYQDNLLFVHWNGNQWDWFNPTNLDMKEKLYGIDCIDTNDCWAVGSTVKVSKDDDDDDKKDKDKGKDDDDEDYNIPVIVHWDGTNWQQFILNNEVDGNLRAVHCISSNDCWAVGNYDNGSNKRPVILHWNGTTWQQQAVPNSVPSKSNLYSVTCTASDDCWAVGEAYKKKPLVLRYNGTQWQMLMLNNSIPKNRILRDVDCLTSDHCWIVGDKQGGDPLYIHWNGSSLDRIDGSQVSGDSNLYSISLIGPRKQLTSAWQQDFY